MLLVGSDVWPVALLISYRRDPCHADADMAMRAWIKLTVALRQDLDVLLGCADF